jgi:hypothetical protein
LKPKHHKGTLKGGGADSGSESAFFAIFDLFLVIFEVFLAIFGYF